MFKTIRARLLALCLLTSVMVSCSVNQTPENVYSINTVREPQQILTGHLNLGTNVSPGGDVLDATSYYFTRNNRPWYPVMGEIHYSRVPDWQWEDAILKMKAAGITVIASYVFWIYHEEEEGIFDFSGQQDVGRFVDLCARHGLYVHLRIGPWVHGEARNGGFPDWIVKKGNTRQNNPEYLSDVKIFWEQVYKQVTGRFFKEGGPVIGIQIENEFRFNNPEGLEHMLTLKKMAREVGFDAPYYTATGWQGADLEQKDYLIVRGGYPEAPWEQHINKLPLFDFYLFEPLKIAKNIGTDLLGESEEVEIKHTSLYPYATAEMGGGMQATYHRRPIIVPEDLMGLHYTRVGVGANLMGYYMFHGGSHSIGRLSTLQESKATNYPNDYPVISYDFTAPIGEWGQLRPSYQEFKILHSFLNNFGHLVSTYRPSFPDRQPSGTDDNSTLRFSVRSDNQRGFVFINNYQRQLEMNDIEQAQFDLKLKEGGILKFPQTPVTIRKNAQMIFPFNMDLSGVTLKYATAQPLCKLNGDKEMYVFFAPDGIQPEYAIDHENIRDIDVKQAELAKNDGVYLVKSTIPGTGCLTVITLTDGRKVNILTLTRRQALDSWQDEVFGSDHLFLSSQELTFPGDGVRVQSTGEHDISVAVYPDVAGLAFDDRGKTDMVEDGIFTRYSTRLPLQKLNVTFKEVTKVDTYVPEKKVPADNRKNQPDPKSPGAQYQTNFEPVEGSKYYEIGLPPWSGKHINDAFLMVDYTGDTWAAYLKGILVADDFYLGLPLTIGLKRFGDGSEPYKMLLQVVPLTAEREIYFEDDIREKIAASNNQGVKKIELIPQYEIILKKR
ncbi:MAG: beta-galactosidase [Bacteroidota bacterium]